MTRLQMKAVKGGGYTLAVGDHTFNIVLDAGTTEGAFGPIRYREYHVYVDDVRVGEAFKTAAEAKDFLVPYVERAQEQERRERSTAMFREFAEEKLFPAGVPKNVLTAMEKYTSTVVVVEQPKAKRATRTKVKTEDKTEQIEAETSEDVAAEVRKSTPRRSRAKSTSKTAAEKRGTTPRRRTSKRDKTEQTAPEPEVTAPPEPETTTAPEPVEPEVSAAEHEAASA